jgi:hypothetical protein
MTILHPTGFPGKIHFYIEDDVARCLKPSRGCFCILTKDFKGNTHIAHFFLERVSPESMFVLSINLDRMFHRGRDFDAIFMTRLSNSRVNGRNNDFPFPQHIWNPPSKGWFISNVASSDILSNLDRV